MAGAGQPDHHRDAGLGGLRADLHRGALYAANLIQSRNFRSFEAYIIAPRSTCAVDRHCARLLNWVARFLFGS
jgi:hypothetical protein